MVIRISDKTQNYSKVTKLLVKPTFKRLDELNKTLIFKENVQIQIDDIVDIELLGQ